MKTCFDIFLLMLSLISAMVVSIILSASLGFSSGGPRAR